MKDLTKLEKLKAELEELNAQKLENITRQIEIQKSFLKEDQDDNEREEAISEFDYLTMKLSDIIQRIEKLDNKIKKCEKRSASAFSLYGVY